jgi:hypothetical protein
MCPGEQIAGIMDPGSENSDQGSGNEFSAPQSLIPNPLIMTSPDQGSQYRLSPQIPPSAQQILVAARPADGVALRQVTLLVDGQPLVTLTRPPYQVLWPMMAGTHTFTAAGADMEGHEVAGNRVVIEVAGGE